MEFPRMVYRVGTMAVLESGTYDHRLVTADEWPDAQAEGWHLDQYAAKDAHEAASEPRDDNAPPTRAELETKAAELGIPYGPRISDKKLSAAIAVKLAEA